MPRKSSQTHATPATVGVLTDPYLFEWQVRAIARMRSELEVDVPLVVRNASPARWQASSGDGAIGLDRGTLARILDGIERERAWMLVLAERALAGVFGDDRPLWRCHPVEDVEALADATHLECEPRIDGNWNELPDEVVAQLADRCDVVIRFGFGLVRGDVLTAPEYGVLSFHPADIRRYRGMGPPIIFRDGRNRAGSTLQRLNQSIDGGEIVAYDEVCLDECYTLWDVYDRIASLQVRLLTHGVANLRDPAFEPETVPDERLGEFYYRSQRKTLEFSASVLAKNLAGRTRRRLGRRRPVDAPEERERTVYPGD